MDDLALKSLRYLRLAGRLLLPPIVLLPRDRLRAKKSLQAEQERFFGSGSLFSALISNARHYAEWGAGQSTRAALNTGLASVTSVETSVEWAQRIAGEYSDDDRLSMIHIDLGDVGPWGWPHTYVNRSRLIDYVRAPFVGEVAPDLLLIDGRVRVACLLTALLEGRPGTSIIFDDYGTRTPYRVVEEVIRPVEVRWRQAVFCVPDTLDTIAVQELRRDFLHVLG